MMIKLSDGTPVHVRLAKRGQKITPRDIEAIEAVRDALYAERIRMRQWGGDPDCNHEDDGEGTCLGCGAQKPW
jgi:hypothetical protein